jgi:hypothetical protein
MQVSQAGRRLTVDVDDPAKTRLEGRLLDGHAELRSRGERGPIASMRARIDPAPGHPGMSGTMRFGDCPGEGDRDRDKDEAEAPFRAHRDDAQR